MAFTIRRATHSDISILTQLIQPVHELHVAAHPEIFKMPDDWSELEPFFATRIEQADNHYFIGEEDGTPVGYVMCEEMRRPADLLHVERHYVYIDEISLNEDARGKGYGKQLIEHVIAFAKELGISQVGLDYWAFNEHASGFFAKMGFRPINTKTFMEI